MGQYGWPPLATAGLLVELLLVYRTRNATVKRPYRWEMKPIGQLFDNNASSVSTQTRFSAL